MKLANQKCDPRDETARVSDMGVPYGERESYHAPKYPVEKAPFHGSAERFENKLSKYCEN